LLRPCENKPAGSRIVVHDSLQIRKEIGRSLRLVQHGTINKPSEESTWVLRGEPSRIRVLEEYIWAVGEKAADQRGLS
jgi:hypothetical protein